MAITAVPKPVFSFPAPKIAPKTWCTFYVSLLCKEVGNRLRGGDLNTNFSYAIYIILYRRLQIVASFFCKVSLQ